MVYRNWFWGLGHSFLWCVCPVNRPLQLLDVTHLDKIGSMKVAFMHSTGSWHPHSEPEVKLLMLHGNELVNSPPTLTGVGHQWTVSTSIGCNQWLSPAKPTLKVPHVGRNRSLVVRTSKCGWAIRYVHVPPSETSNKIRGNNPAHSNNFANVQETFCLQSTKSCKVDIGFTPFVDMITTPLKM
jgi:hypothetical protein